MRILLVTHDYLPRNRAGVEIHAAWLAAGLVRQGHEVRIFTTEKAMAWPDGALQELEVDGIPVWRMVRNRMFRNLRETWDFPRAGQLFRQLLAQWQPQVVHFHHLLYLSFDLPSLAREAGAATVMTLHDYWLQCRLMGQRLDPWGRICRELDDLQCGRCLAAVPPEGAGRGKRWGAVALRTLRRLTGLDLGPWARQRALARRAEAPAEGGEALPPEPGLDQVRRAAGEIARRREAVFTRVVPYIDCFRAPSRFLAEQFLQWGLPAARVHHHPLGVEEVAVERTPRGDRVRFAFLGTVAPHKGVDLLLRAFRGLQDRATLSIHGGAPYHADYAALVERLCRETGATWSGAYAPAAFGDLLGRCDCLVVPSLWFENSPLTILQARRAGIPSLVSDLGGMAELVAGGPGWTFPVGDEAGLRSWLVRLCEEPELLDRTGSGTPVPSMEDDVLAHLECYEDLVTGGCP